MLTPPIPLTKQSTSSSLQLFSFLTVLARFFICFVWDQVPFLDWYNKIWWLRPLERIITYASWLWSSNWQFESCQKQITLDSTYLVYLPYPPTLTSSALYALFCTDMVDWIHWNHSYLLLSGCALLLFYSACTRSETIVLIHVKKSELNWQFVLFTW